MTDKERYEIEQFYKTLRSDSMISIENLRNNCTLAAEAIDKLITENNSLRNGKLFTGFSLETNDFNHIKLGSELVVENLEIANNWNLVNVFTDGLWRGTTHHKLVLVLARDDRFSEINSGVVNGENT